jgi:quercetin dioxygenase-like cupin family protein
MKKVDPAAVARALTEFWSQEVIGRANGNLVKVAKGIGSTRWHAHDDQEETFLVLEGQLTIQLRGENIHLAQGDFFIVPRGVEHCPTTEHGASFLMFGPDVTSNAAGGKPDWSYGGGGADDPSPNVEFS